MGPGAVGRNDPCPCGSGNKYKKCCLFKEEETRNLHDDPVCLADSDIEALAEEALDMVKDGRLGEGRMKAEALLRRYPHSQFAHFAMGVVHAFQREFDAAIVCFDNATRFDPYYTEAYFNKAVAYKEQLDVENVIRSFQQVVLRGQPDDEIVIEAGRFLKDMERNIRKQHDVDLDDYLVGREMFDRAFAAMEGRKWQEALDGFRECIRKIKNHSQSYGNMGICLAMLGQREKSLEAFNKALEIDPSYEPAMNNRALVENLKDGERLAEDKFYSVDYSKEKFERNKKRD